MNFPLENYSCEIDGIERQIITLLKQKNQLFFREIMTSLSLSFDEMKRKIWHLIQLRIIISKVRHRPKGSINEMMGDRRALYLLAEGFSDDEFITLNQEKNKYYFKMRIQNNTDQRILLLLKEKPMTRQELLAHLPQARTTIYDHLAILIELGIITPINADAQIVKGKKKRGRCFTYFHYIGKAIIA